MKENTTITYYNRKAQEFVQDTCNVGFTEIPNRFIRYLNSGSRILDLGCGSGRDTKYFLDQGFDGVATDGSAELCRIASEYTGIEVKQMLFDELSEVAAYDGIWACASILHLPYDELVAVLKKITVALRPNGVLYTSFKYGTYEGERNGRFFIDMTEGRLDELLADAEGLAIEELWFTGDVRPGREDEKWLNVIMRKL